MAEGMADESRQFNADEIRAGDSTISVALGDGLSVEAQYSPAPLIDLGEAPVSAGTSRGRIRRFVWEGHPESGIEVPPAITYRLRNDDPFHSSSQLFLPTTSRI
jgi:hypothetical protein